MSVSSKDNSGNNGKERESRGVENYIKLKFLGLFDGEAQGPVAIVALTLLAFAIVVIAIATSPLGSTHLSVGHPNSQLPSKEDIQRSDQSNG